MRWQLSCLFRNDLIFLNAHKKCANICLSFLDKIKVDKAEISPMIAYVAETIYCTSFDEQ